ncbi:S8 family serine peptidase [Microbacterium sp. GXF7504]
MTRRAVAAGAVLGMLLLGIAVPAHAETSGECDGSTRIDREAPALQMLQRDLAWGVTRGAGVTVAVVDSGVGSNPHLTGAVTGGTNLVPDGADPAGRTDDYGHGTAIAGQIAAREIAGSAVVGLAPEAAVLPVRVYAGVEQQQREAGLGPTTERLAQGIRYAADQGAQIINVSLSAPAADPAVTEAVAYATARGSLVVGSAGNRDGTIAVDEDAREDGPRYPAGDLGALGVAASDLDGVVGDASIHGPHVAVAAPGQMVLTTAVTGGDCFFAPDVPMTSYASGYVAAAAALVAAAHPDETPAEWAYRLQASAVRADPDARDDAAGWGVVQPYDAIMLAPGPGIRGPERPDGADAASARDDATAAPLVVADRPPADAAAIAWGGAAAVGGLVLLGAVGALGAAAARRRGTIGTTPAGRGGLYGEPAAED